MSQPKPKPMFIVNAPWGPVAVDPSLPGVRKQIVCAKEGCKNIAVKVWCGEGRLAEKQLCNAGYDEEFKKALLEEARKQRREAIKTT